jgi:HNH endonuclease
VSEYVSADLRREVRDQFRDRCAYCLTPEHLTVATFEIEHIIPRAAGGETVFANLCVACPSCNRCKSDRTVAIDPETGQAVPLFHPHRDTWTDHFAWNDGATEIVGLTPSGRASVAALRMNRPQFVRVRRMWVRMGEYPPESR